MPTLDLKVVALPEHDDMLRRLESVIDISHAKEQLFPLILKSAGNELNGMGVVMMIQLAIYDYAERLPPVMSGLLQFSVRPLIEALVDDEVVKADALNFMDEVESKANNQSATRSN